MASPALSRESFCLASSSKAMLGLERAILDLCRTTLPVLFLGERGTGKRSLALRIHELSFGAGAPFQILEAASTTPDEIEHVIATQTRGTTFIREVTELSSATQSRLMQVWKMAETHDEPQVFRLIASSSKDVAGAVRLTRFREDLYYRLSAMALSVPPLRQRREDIPVFISAFATRFSQQLDRTPPNLNNGFLTFALRHSWPGNIRELEDAVRTAVAIGDERVALAALREVGNGKKRNGQHDSLKEAARDASRAAEKELILKTLTRTRWNRKLAARELKISYRALLYKVKQIGIDERPEGAESEGAWAPGE